MKMAINFSIFLFFPSTLLRVDLLYYFHCSCFSISDGWTIVSYSFRTIDLCYVLTLHVPYLMKGTMWLLVKIYALDSRHNILALVIKINQKLHVTRVKIMKAPSNNFSKMVLGDYFTVSEIVSAETCLQSCRYIYWTQTKMQ